MSEQKQESEQKNCLADQSVKVDEALERGLCNDCSIEDCVMLKDEESNDEGDDKGEEEKKPKAKPIPLPEADLKLNPLIAGWRDSKEVDSDLMTSIRDRGQVQPILARKLPSGELELVAGHRRYWANRALGKTKEQMLTEGSLRVVENVGDVEAVLMAISENSDRKDLSPIEEARSFQSLRKLRLEVEDIAKKINKSESYVRERLNLLELPPDILKHMEKVKFSFAEPLLKLNKYPEAQKFLLKEIMDGQGNRWSAVNTVKQAEDHASQLIKQIKDKQKLNKLYGPCPKCQGTNLTEQGYGPKEKIECVKCRYSWNRETKQPWALYEMAAQAKAMGLDMKVTDGKVELSPAEMEKLVAAQKGEEGKDGKVKPTFRSFRQISELLLPLIQDNVQDFSVNGEEITVKLMAKSGLIFNAFQHHYKSGEKTKIVARADWTGESTLEKMVPKVKAYVNDPKATDME